VPEIEIRSLEAACLDDGALAAAASRFLLDHREKPCTLRFPAHVLRQEKHIEKQQPKLSPGPKAAQCLSRRAASSAPTGILSSIPVFSIL
jgi:hypothetical protein